MNEIDVRTNQKLPPINVVLVIADVKGNDGISFDVYSAGKVVSFCHLCNSGCCLNKQPLDL